MKKIKDVADKLYKVSREEFSKVEEHRPMNVEVALEDALQSGLAMFALKDPSLLAFDKRRENPENLKRVFGIERVPCDTQMRKILDGVEPEKPRPVYKRVFEEYKRTKALNTTLDTVMTTYRSFLPS